MEKYHVEYTDTFGGEPNYAWVRRATITMPDLTNYGWDGSTGYLKACRTYQRELMRRAKAAMGLTGVRGQTQVYGGLYEFRPYRSNTVLFVTNADV